MPASFSVSLDYVVKAVVITVSVDDNILVGSNSFVLFCCVEWCAVNYQNVRTAVWWEFKKN